MNAFDFLQWVLSGFWRTIGLSVIVGSLASGIGAGIRAVRK